MKHLLQTVSRQFRLFVRHVRFYRPFDPGGRERKKTKALAELFRVANQYLSQLNVDYWLVDDTLLGYFREGGILMHDRDIDIGAHEKEYSKIWQTRHALPSGFTMRDTSYRHRGPKLYIEYQGWEADIYFYEDRNHQLLSYTDSRIGGEYKPFPKTYIYPLQDTVFLGENTHVPHRIKAYLEHMYGYIGVDAVQDKKTGYWFRNPGRLMR